MEFCYGIIRKLPLNGHFPIISSGATIHSGAPSFEALIPFSMSNHAFSVRFDVGFSFYPVFILCKIVPLYHNSLMTRSTLLALKHSVIKGLRFTNIQRKVLHSVFKIYAIFLWKVHIFFKILKMCIAKAAINNFEILSESRSYKTTYMGTQFILLIKLKCQQLLAF